MNAVALFASSVEPGPFQRPGRAHRLFRRKLIADDRVVQRFLVRGGQSLQGAALLLAQPPPRISSRTWSGSFSVPRSWKSRLRRMPTISATASHGASPSCVFSARKRRRPVDRVEVVADDVLHELLHEAAILWYVAHDRRNRRQPSLAGGAQASLAMHHDVDVTIGVIAHGNRLQDAFASDARRQLLQPIRDRMCGGAAAGSASIRSSRISLAVGRSSTPTACGRWSVNSASTVNRRRPLAEI